jgi:hypothetical protein
MILTTKIRPSKPRVREAYTTSFMHIFIVIKFHELCCDFYGQVHILGTIGTNMPHGLGTAAPPGRAGPAGAAVPAGAAALSPWHASSPSHILSRRHNLNEQD